MGYEEISAKYVKGRRTYRCEWCGQVIQKGEKHLTRAYKFEGEFNCGRMHLECEEAMYDDSDASEGWLFGSNERPKPLSHNGTAGKKEV